MDSSFHIYIGSGKHDPRVIVSSDNSMLLALKERDVPDQQKIIELYDELRPSLYAYLSTLGLNAGEAEDVIQESFFRLVRHFPEKNIEENLRGWLFRVAHNLSMDVHRDANRDQTVLPEDSEAPIQEQVDPALNPEQAYLQEEKMKRLNLAMERLTPQQRHSILLRAEGLRYQDIALVLGISPQRAAMLVQRGLVRLAALCE